MNKSSIFFERFELPKCSKILEGRNIWKFEILNFKLGVVKVCDTFVESYQKGMVDHTLTFAKPKNALKVTS
jgi:hypothetical protein